jgi:hypothetical protein
MHNNKPTIPQFTNYRTLEAALRQRTSGYRHAGFFITERVDGIGCTCFYCSKERAILLKYVEEKAQQEYRRQVDYDCPQAAARFHNDDFHAGAQAGAYSATTSWDIPHPDEIISQPENDPWQKPGQIYRMPFDWIAPDSDEV